MNNTDEDNNDIAGADGNDDHDIYGQQDNGAELHDGEL